MKKQTNSIEYVFDFCSIFNKKNHLKFFAFSSFNFKKDTLFIIDSFFYN